jgi:hypothetical protein
MDPKALVLKAWIEQHDDPFFAQQTVKKMEELGMIPAPSVDLIVKIPSDMKHVMQKVEDILNMRSPLYSIEYHPRSAKIQIEGWR